MLNFSGSENENNSEEAKNNLDAENYALYDQRTSNPFEPATKQKYNGIDNSIKNENSILSNKFKEIDGHNLSCNNQNTTENYEIFNANKNYQLSHEDIKVEVDDTQTK